ncbi:DUF3592 domain-containing protein [Cupriavidus gilardii]|uniref:DUF3592 domain-containing protein n=1 Tax=Cupriavidus gilardii TaxID=82541 RepID=UPI0021C1D6A9|nr:DUF3592 domain-containing protein [Cupriavidus gilardii]MCT9127371.1 DUF3592 domain-containing protein [Cupriavidus gilardii]
MKGLHGAPVLAAVGILFLMLGVAFVRSGSQFRRRPDRVGWRRAEGVIVGYRPGPWTGPATEQERLLFPVVRYVLPDGSEREFVNPTTVDTGLYRTGITRPILVNPADPSQAELASSRAVRASLHWGHVVLGGVFCVGGAAMLAVAVLLLALAR